MADSPTTTNQAATVADQAIKALIFDVAVKAAELEIVTAVPILGAPVLKQINEALLNFIAQKIYEQLAIGATFVIIDKQTNQEAADAHAAKDKLTAALTAGSQAEIDQATEDFKDAFSKLVHTDGSLRP